MLSFSVLVSIPISSSGWCIKAVYSFNGRHFCDANDKNATVELKKLSPIGFEKFFHLSSRWQKCAVAEGDCFEGNVD
jgi:hypothetical protein